MQDQMPKAPGHSLLGLRYVGRVTCDATTADSQFLYGYPCTKRINVGVHDSLLASAICLDDGEIQAMFIAVDVIFLTKQQKLQRLSKA